MSTPRRYNRVAATPATNYVTRRVLWFSIVAVASTYILYNADNMQETFLPFGFLHRSIYPQQVVLAALTVYLLVDLAWYHPDFRNKASNKPKTTTATNSRNTSSSANELFSSLLKPPSFSIDVAEDVMTMLFMLFILTTADETALRHMNGMIIAILAKMTVKVAWHTTTSLVFGEERPSRHLVHWMETSYLSPTTASTHSIHEKPSLGHQTVHQSTSKDARQKQNQMRNRNEVKNTDTVGKPASNPYYWLIHGHEYDLNDFVRRHPGGKEAILLGRGRDCTALFESYHSFTQLNRYVLGA